MCPFDELISLVEKTSRSPQTRRVYSEVMQSELHAFCCDPRGLNLPNWCCRAPCCKVSGVAQSQPCHANGWMQQRRRVFPRASKHRTLAVPQGSARSSASACTTHSFPRRADPLKYRPSGSLGALPVLLSSSSCFCRPRPLQIICLKRPKNRSERQKQTSSSSRSD